MLGQVNTFKYLDCDVSYQEEKDIDCKITILVEILRL